MSENRIIIITDVGEILTKCRVCLNENVNTFPLYEIRDSVKYYNLIEEYTGYDLIERDNFPKCICDQCVSELMIVVRFISKIRISNERLEELLKSFDNPVTSGELQKNEFAHYDDFETDNVELLCVKSEITETKTASQPISNSTQEEYDKLKSELSFGLKFAKKNKVKRHTKNCKRRNIPTDQSDDKNLPTNSSVKSDENKAPIDINEFVNTFCDNIVDPKNNAYEEVRYKIIRSIKPGIKKKVIKCLLCGVLSQNKSAFLVHSRKHTGERPYKCPSCPKCFTQVGTLNTHLRRAHIVKKDADKKEKRCTDRYTCDACGKTYTLRSSLITHLRFHKKDQQLQCPFCPQRFVQGGERSVHVRIHHTGEKPFFCDKCGKSFAASTNLTTHMLSHSDERRFKCNICNKAMKSNDNVKKHIIVMHTPNKRHICELCGAAFALRNKLNNHVKIWHINKRPGFCEICKKSFFNIDKHMKRHSGDKPFACDMCHKTFFLEKHLLQHSKKHTNENATFKCTYADCSSAFSKKCVLDFHVMKYHTKETPFVCRYCLRGFYRKGDLGRHVISNHSIIKAGSAVNTEQVRNE